MCLLMANPFRHPRARARPTLPQGIEHNFGERLTGLTRQGVRELRGFGVADMNLIPHGCFLGAERHLRQSGTYVPRHRHRCNEAAGRGRTIAYGGCRESYLNRFATALAGVDLDNPATVRGRTSGTVVGPRIVGPIRRLLCGAA